MPKTRKQPTIHTEASIRSTLEAMKITLVGQTIPPNVRTRLHYRCITCQYEWESMLFHVLDGYGCTRCKGTRVSLLVKDVQAKLAPHIIKFAHTPTGIRLKSGVAYTFECAQGHRWERHGKTILRDPTCPECRKMLNKSLQAEKAHQRYIARKPQPVLAPLLAEHA